MKKIRTLLFTILVVLLPLHVVGAELPAVEDGKGLVILYRIAKVKGAAIRFNFMSSSGFSGTLENGSWVFEQLEPGKYVYSVSSPSIDGQDSITISVAVGKTYYLKGEIRWGWPAGRTKFMLQPESLGKSELAKIK